MPTIAKKDGTTICYKDWGADAWEDQMVSLASHGFRTIAHDRRGHGRSSQPWNGNNLSTYADDLSALLAFLRE
jgi:non-heme chloroperoxidase